MRIFLFCVDALEYDYVHFRDYVYLKQNQHFKLEIPENCLTLLDDGTLKPFTPVIWKCIFTGRPTSENPASKPERYKNPLLNWLLGKSVVRNSWKALLNTGLIRRGLPERIGLKRKNIIEGEESIFSIVDKTHIQTNPVTAEVKWAGIGQKLKPFEIMNKFENIFENEKKEALENINKPWDIYVFYTKLLDVVGHLFWGRDEIIEKYYRKIEEFSKILCEVLSDDVAFVVLSDHGMMSIKETQIGGDHSFHAYMSFSHDVEIDKPKTILDIRPVIEELLRQ